MSLLARHAPRTAAAAVLAPAAIVAMLASPAAAGQESAPTGPTRIHVSEHKGSDDGDGTADQPFATIRRALALIDKLPERAYEIHLDLGHYGTSKGEIFPIRLPRHVRLTGFGSSSCEIVGLPEQPVLELPASGEVAVESVALRGGAVGIAAVASVAGTAEAALDLALVDVAIERCTVGVDLSPARGRLELRADGLRLRDATTGLLAAGGAELTLALSRSDVRGCNEGVVIGCDGAPENGPFHAVTVRGCRFDGNAEAGLVRRGKDGRNRAPEPWTIESSLFRGSRIGLSLEIPGGDVPFVIRDCELRENAIFGLALVGSGTPLEGSSRIEGCRLRWNGVGAQILTMGRPLELAGCRFEDSMGTGLHFGNFVGVRSVLQASRCLFVCNGAAGFYGLCEREGGIDVTLDRCTIADNRGSGVERRNRKVGSGPIRLSRCIVAGNATDLVRIEPGEVEGCFVGGDPLFVDRRRRDFRLAPGSPARGEGDALGAPGEAPAHGSR